MRRGWRSSLWIPSLLVLLLTVGLPAASALPSHTAAPPIPVGGLTANVTWNGLDVHTASTTSSAISSGLGSTIRLHYAWSAPPGAGTGPRFNMSTARLEMLYFGFSLATRDVVSENPRAAPNGTFDMTWDAGYLHWILAGMYELKASLIATNGTTVWEQQFFVRVSVPGGLGAALPILLIVIAGAELYDLATSGRQAGIRKGPTTPEKEAEKTEGPVEPSSSATPPSDGTSPPPEVP